MSIDWAAVLVPKVSLLELFLRGTAIYLFLFVLLRVLHALSERPTFQVLPNPYDERFRSFYDIVEAGARIRYRVNVAETFEL